MKKGWSGEREVQVYEQAAKEVEDSEKLVSGSKGEKSSPIQSHLERIKM